MINIVAQNLWTVIIFFQAFDEKIASEMNLIGEDDIKVESKEFCNANDEQANCSGTSWIIICLCYFLCSIDFIVCFIICFTTIFAFLSNMDYFIQLYISLIFCSRRRNGIRLWRNSCEDEPLSPLLECDQVCSTLVCEGTRGDTTQGSRTVRRKKKKKKF